MTDFRSFKTARREPAAAMRPVVDPAGWTADALKDVSAWSYKITESDADELEAAVAAGDGARAAQAAHVVTGCSATMGATRLAGLARDTERAAVKGCTAELATLLSALRAAVPGTVSALQDVGQVAVDG